MEDQWMKLSTQIENIHQKLSDACYSVHNRFNDFFRSALPSKLKYKQIGKFQIWNRDFVVVLFLLHQKLLELHIRELVIRYVFFHYYYYYYCAIPSNCALHFNLAFFFSWELFLLHYFFFQPIFNLAFNASSPIFHPNDLKLTLQLIFLLLFLCLHSSDFSFASRISESWINALATCADLPIWKLGLSGIELSICCMKYGS